MNIMFRNFLDKFFIVFLGDIFFYSKMEEELEKHLCMVVGKRVGGLELAVVN
jgi:hypothetical protein